MAPHHSESADEGDEGEDYTATSVLLGYASAEATGDAVSHLGGAPRWLDDATPPGALATCAVCNGLLTLLLQLNGDLPAHFPGHARRLYVWTCRRTACRRQAGSVRAMRAVRLARPDKPAAGTVAQKPPPRWGESLFGVEQSNRPAPSNPFSSKPAHNATPFGASMPTVKVTPQDPSEAKQDEASTTLPETLASKARLSSPPAVAQPPRPHDPWPAESAFPAPFPHYNLDAEYETLDAPSTPAIPDSARMDMDTEGGREDKEVYESSLDKTFQRFADRIGENAEQVLRYEFKGKPLLYSDSDAVGKLLAPHSENGPSSNAKITTTSSRRGAGMPRCQNCGAERVFEVQLTPHAITELEAEELSLDGMEWGTIIMGVCAKDCSPSHVSEGEVGYLEEWVGVQWEEIASKK